MNSKTICITTGNLDGVGLEVTYKAFCKLTPKKNIKYIIIKSIMPDPFNFFKLKQFNTASFSSVELALKDSQNNLCIVESCNSPSQWFIDSVALAKANKITSICTGPISKLDTSLHTKDVLGHTSILRDAFADRTLTMAFLGKHFNVALASDHIPLNEVTAQLNEISLINTINNITAFSLENKDLRPIAVLGLNPHAGESGLLGSFEQNTLIPCIEKLRLSGANLTNPISADTAFLEENWNKYSFYLAMYHDQGLIPFKMLHGFDSGVQITLNLPFNRLSVDHGTATNIYNKNSANENSMLLCIEMAEKLSRKKCTNQ